MSRIVFPALLLLAAFAASVPSRASGGGQEDARAEAARIERRLERIEARVLETDLKLRQMNEALGAELLAAMDALSPGVADDARRLAVLRARSVDGGGTEARRLETRVDAARRAALRDRRLASMVAAFNALVREKMILADPDAAGLLERYAELHGDSAARAP